MRRETVRNEDLLMVDDISEESPRAFIEARNVSRTYLAIDGSSTPAVLPTSFDIRASEFICILGPSGCGKSTLLLMLAGLLTPSSGEIAVDGKVLRGPHKKCGMVFQDAVLFPWRTVQRNVELPQEVLGIARQRRAAKATEMIDLVNLNGFAGKFPHELSGGMQQRVAIARALSLEPTLLLMDEPFGALDAMTREQMNMELQRISLETKATVIFVTHSIVEAAFLADRVFVMSERPSTVSHIVEIDIPRPRPLALMSSDQLGKYVGQLRALLGSTEGAL
jgi:NitT/TauT family transport system ATP-binding protein